MKNKLIKTIIILFVVAVIGVAVVSNSGWLTSKVKRSMDNSDESKLETIEYSTEVKSESGSKDELIEDNYARISLAATNMNDVEYKELNESFDFENIKYYFGTPKRYDEFQSEWDYDENEDDKKCENGYVEVPVRIEALTDLETYLNSIYIKCFDDSFNYICGYEPTTSNMKKDMRKSYYACDMKKGDKISVNLVYADTEAVYDKAKYIVLFIDNHGGYTGKSSDYKLIKVKGF